MYINKKKYKKGTLMSTVKTQNHLFLTSKTLLCISNRSQTTVFMTERLIFWFK